MAELRDCPEGSVNIQLNLYLYAFYWALATVTTIGYGDVTPQTSRETCFAILIMVLGGFFWAWVLGSACVILGALTESETMFKQSVDKMNMLIGRSNISQSLGKDLRAYLYNTSEARQARVSQEVLSLVSPELQGKVFFEWFGEWILQVAYIADGSPAFVVEVARALNIQVYAPVETIHQRRTLFALDRGIAWRKMTPLTKGAVWGQDMILHSDNLRDEVLVYCITFVEARYIHYNTFSDVIENHPKDKARLRNYLVRLALRRGILVYAKRVWDAEQQIHSRLADKKTGDKGSTSGTLDKGLSNGDVNEVIQSPPPLRSIPPPAIIPPPLPGALATT
jgi:hypothetical protein